MTVLYRKSLGVQFPCLVESFLNAQPGVATLKQSSVLTQHIIPQDYVSIIGPVNLKVLKDLYAVSVSTGGPK